MASWIPLESNPDVMNKFLHGVGVPTKWEVVDVYGLEDDQLAVVPRPVLAVILLSPWTEKFREHIKTEDEELKQTGQEISENVYFMKQFVRNACGTIALIHSVANNLNMIELEDGHLKKFIEETKGLDPVARGKQLEKADGISTVHKDAAHEGQTEAPTEGELANFAFTAFVCKDESIYELDGAKSFPVNHGFTTPDTFLEDVAKVCKKFIEREPENVCFTVLALTHAVA